MPVSREEIRAVVERYPRPPVVATVGSHSALDIADGAVTEGFTSVVLAQAGREATYAQYLRTLRHPDGAGGAGASTRSGRILGSRGSPRPTPRRPSGAGAPSSSRIAR